MTDESKPPRVLERHELNVEEKMKSAPGWKRPPRPTAGWLLVTFGFALRAWALPFVVAGWVAGVCVQAFAFGWSFVFDDPLLRRGQTLISGERKRVEAAYSSDDDWDDDEIE